MAKYKGEGAKYIRGIGKVKGLGRLGYLVAKNGGKLSRSRE